MSGMDAPGRLILYETLYSEYFKITKFCVTQMMTSRRMLTYQYLTMLIVTEMPAFSTRIMSVACQPTL